MLGRGLVLGCGLVLGRDLLITADVIRTGALEPTLEHVTALGVLVLVWTFRVVADDRAPRTLAVAARAT